MVQLVASAAASAIAATVNTQAAEGRARQAGAAADQSGGFAAILALLLPGAQPSPGPSQDQAAAELSSLTAQQGAADAAQINGAAGTTNSVPNGSAPQSSVAGQSSGNPADNLSGQQAANWLAALSDSVAAQSEQAAGGPGTPSNGKPANAQTTQPGSPAADPGLAAALQSLLAPPNTQIQNTQAATPAAANAIDAANSASNGTAALIQAMKAQQAALAASNAGTAAQPSSTASGAVATLNTAANAIPAAPAQHAQFTQAAQTALHQGATAPVTEAQSLPLHFDLGSGGAGGSGGSGGSSTGQSGQHGANANPSAPSQPVNVGDATSATAPQPAVALAHAQTPDSTAAANTAVAGAAAIPASQPQQQTVATLQVGPAGQAAVPNVHALAVSIATQSQAGAKQFDIRLDPPELGRVDVRLTVDATGKAQAHLAVDKPQTLELLQKDSGSLARALKDSGVQLGNNGLQFSLKGQGRQGDGSPRTPSRSRALAVTAVTSSTAATSSSASIPASLAGVDIRV